MSSHCSRCAKLHLHLPFYRSSYKFCSLMFDLFFIETHHWTLDIFKILICFFLTTSLYALPIHIETSSSSCGFTTTKSLMLRSINRVYVYLKKASSSSTRNKEQWLDLLHDNFHDDWLQGLNHSWTSNCLMAKSLPKEWNFDEVNFSTNVIKYPPNIPHIGPSWVGLLA